MLYYSQNQHHPSAIRQLHNCCLKNHLRQEIIHFPWVHSNICVCLRLYSRYRRNRHNLNRVVVVQGPHYSLRIPRHSSLVYIPPYIVDTVGGPFSCYDVLHQRALAFW